MIKAYVVSTTQMHIEEHFVPDTWYRAQGFEIVDDIRNAEAVIISTKFLLSHVIDSWVKTHTDKQFYLLSDREIINKAATKRGVILLVEVL